MSRGSAGHRQWNRVGDGGAVRGDGEASARAGSEVVRRGDDRGGQRERVASERVSEIARLKRIFIHGKKH